MANSDRLFGLCARMQQGINMTAQGHHSRYHGDMKHTTIALLLLIAPMFSALASDPAYPVPGVPVETATSYSTVEGLALPGVEPGHGGAPVQTISNGIRLSDYKGFEKKWKLVTVTYRTDAQEIRFSYANDKAYQTLLKNSIDYPEGAVFIKVVMMSQGDPAFVTSQTPGQVSRYQVMVRDSKKYPGTDGWGYGIFAGTDWGHDGTGWDGEKAPVNLHDMGEKCHACHEVVKDRGYVFSQLPKMEPGSPNPTIKNLTPQDATPGVEFKDMPRGDLPPILRQLVPDKFDTVRRVTGKMAKFGHMGVAFEIRPSLIIESVRTGKPVIFYHDTGGSLSLIVPTDKKLDPVSPTCRAGHNLYASYIDMGSSIDNWPSKDLFCYGTAPGAAPHPDM